MKSGMSVMMMFLIAAAGVAVIPMSVRADYPDHGMYLGAYGGFNLKTGKWSLGSVADTMIDGSLQPRSSPVWGVRWGYHFLPQLIGEAGLGLLPVKSSFEVNNTVFKIDLDLYYHLLRKDISPFIGIGTGSHMCTNNGDLGSDFDLQMHFSLGVRSLITPAIALRFEVRDYIIDDYSENGIGQNLEITGGIDFYLNAPKETPPPPPPPAPPPPPPSDRDNDGVLDDVDNCPDQTGVPEYQGCVPEAMKSFTGAIKGIYFQTGSARILPKSYTTLDRAVAELEKYKTLRLRIEGHTDNAGKPDLNRKLSESRAESVKAYFISKGIDSSRLETAGYGDTRPVEDNKTAAGRAANRRIEFSIPGGW
ncbi:MAG: OmpA family protein [Chitinispirillaceae bacterium]|nr:OmpA family protein [Chitinispirillaceae bacterium]